MRLRADGWNVEIDHIFHGQKDVDVRAEMDGEVRFIDVLSMAPNPLHESSSGFYPMPGSRPLDPKLRAKPQEKFDIKFQEAKAAGWSGSAWVAMNIARDDDNLIEASFRRMLTGQDWQADLAGMLKREASGLDGVIYFAHSQGQHMVAAAPLRWLSLR